jgi:hypothetical protein
MNESIKQLKEMANHALIGNMEQIIKLTGRETINIKTAEKNGFRLVNYVQYISSLNDLAVIDQINLIILGDAYNVYNIPGRYYIGMGVNNNLGILNIYHKPTGKVLNEDWGKAAYFINSIGRSAPTNYENIEFGKTIDMLSDKMMSVGKPLQLALEKTIYQTEIYNNTSNIYVYYIVFERIDALNNCYCLMQAKLL